MLLFLVLCCASLLVDCWKSCLSLERNVETEKDEWERGNRNKGRSGLNSDGARGKAVRRRWMSKIVADGHENAGGNFRSDVTSIRPSSFTNFKQLLCPSHSERERLQITYMYRTWFSLFSSYDVASYSGKVTVWIIGCSDVHGKWQE